MKRLPAKRWMIGACVAIAGTLGGSVEASAAQAGAAKPATDTSYGVRVEVKETRNRRLEGTVRQHKLYVDQPAAFGADDTAPTPPETLAFALGSCVVSTGRLLAMQRGLEVRHLSAVVEGKLDFARALGVTTERRAGFEGFRVRVQIEAALSPEAREQFLREIAARCPLCDNLSNATPVTLEVAEAADPAAASLVPPPAGPRRSDEVPPPGASAGPR